MWIWGMYIVITTLRGETRVRTRFFVSQVYLAQYFELFSLFDEIDTGSVLPLSR